MFDAPSSNPPPPAQNGQITSTFALLDDPALTGHPIWRPFYPDFENPAWGWVVYDFASNTIQIFLPDGKLHTSISPDRSARMPLPLLYNVAPIPEVARSQQLDVLCKKLGERAYWQAFVDVILGATPRPSNDASTLSQEESAVEGKPYALVYIRLSLSVSSAQPDNKNSFLIKFGGTRDYNYSDDGLVSCFPALSPPKIQSQLDLGNVYAFPASNPPSLPSASPSVPNPLVLISPSNYPPLHQTIATSMDSSLTVFGALVDPDKPLHAEISNISNSAAQPLSIPDDKAQQAIEKIASYALEAPGMGDLPPMGLPLLDGPARKDVKLEAEWEKVREGMGRP